MLAANGDLRFRARDPVTHLQRKFLQRTEKKTEENKLDSRVNCINLVQIAPSFKKLGSFFFVIMSNTNTFLVVT